MTSSTGLHRITIHCRKVCLNCRCGKAEHNVVDDHDPGFYFVGKIFDRPLRSRQEEMEFCYGDVEEDSFGSGSSNGSGDESARRNGAAAKNKGQRKTVRFDWIPPNVSKTLVSALLRHVENAAKFFCRRGPVCRLPRYITVQSGSDWQGFTKHDNPSSKLGSVVS